MIYIRTDANEVIATGHVMRCITVARQLQKLGEEVRFIVSDEYPMNLLKDANMEVICLDSKWDQYEEELPKMEQLLSAHPCSTIIVDSYSATSNYLKRLKAFTKVVYFDDLFEEAFDADMLINYNVYSERFPYKERYGMDTKLLLGGKYVPLREEFLNNAREQKNQIKDVLLICGGGDRYNCLGGIAEYINENQRFKNYRFHIVVGMFNKNKDFLMKLKDKNDQFILYENVKNMAELMKQCDVCISAASTVLYELCALQIPTIFFILADNQIYDREAFSKDDMMLFAGDIRLQREKCIEDICSHLSKLMEHPEQMQDMREKMRQVIDGMGASRIANEVRLLSE